MNKKDINLINTALSEMRQYHHQPTQPTVLKVEKTKDSTVIEGLTGTIVIKDNPALDNPLPGGIMILGGKQYHIRDLWMEIFKMGTTAHESWKGKEDHQLQALFDYWLKDKIGME